MRTDVSSAEVGIEFFHHKVHSGDGFCVTDAVASFGPATKRWKILTGAKALHCVIEVKSGGAATANLLEGVTNTGLGTALTPFNYNRNEQKPIVTVFTKDPTSTGGTTIFTQTFGQTGIPAQRVGGDGRLGQEWILKPSTEYSIDLIEAGTGQPISLEIAGYEV